MTHAPHRKRSRRIVVSGTIYCGALEVEDEPGIGSLVWGLFWKHGRYWRNNSRFNKHGTQERQLVGGILIVTQRFCVYKATLPIADSRA